MKDFTIQRFFAVVFSFFTATLTAGAAMSQDHTPTRAGIDSALAGRQFSP